MTFQIFSTKSSKETLMQWLNYLGLLLPSKAQKEADTKTYLEKLLSLIKMYSLDNLFEIWGEEIVKEEEKEEVKIIKQVIPNDLHVKQGPGGCLISCEKIIHNAGYTHDKINVMVLTTNVNNNNFDFHKECTFKAVEVINQHLESGKPIIVGINYKDGSSNFDGVTDHWVVITGRGKDSTGIYYNFFEVAQDKDKGVSADNKLYLLESGVLKGKCTCNRNYKNQWVTMVRPLGDFTFKCCGREIYQNKSEGWGNWEKYCEECKKDPGYYNKKNEKHINIIQKP